MAPFKKQYKFDIISKRSVKQQEDMPKCFLADDLKTAENLFNEFSKFMNYIAYSYSASTGLSKEDLFCEALIGLGRAYRDWDQTRSNDFTAYAKFRIRDSLNEFIRENITLVSIPVYIQKAQNNIRKLRQVCEEEGLDYLEILKAREFPESLKENNILIEYIANAASRAKVEYLEFLDRILLLPEHIAFDDYMVVDQREEEKLEAAMVVKQLKTHMTKEDQIICDGIMNDLTLEQIGKKLGKSTGWVSKKVGSLKDRILAKIKEEEWTQ